MSWFAPAQPRVLGRPGKLTLLMIFKLDSGGNPVPRRPARADAA